jgi:hypothetical protein
MIAGHIAGCGVSGQDGYIVIGYLFYYVSILLSGLSGLIVTHLRT